MEENVEENDRISGLPLSIRFRILSYLDMTEVIQTRFLSSKWQTTWKFVTNLSFDYRIWKKKKTKKGKVDLSKNKKQRERESKERERELNVDSFLDFVERVLILRESHYMQRFHLLTPPNLVGKRIESLLFLSVNRSAEEILLDIFESGGRTLGRTVQLPEILFSSSTIRFFKVDKSKAKSVTVTLPNSLCSARHLKSLELVSVLLPQSYIGGDLFMNFPVLENFMLKDCYGDFQFLSITAPQLRILTVVNLEGKLAICTPNLRTWHIYGYHHDDCYVEEDLSLLVSVHLDVPTRCMLEILKEFHNARTLTLSNMDLESPSTVFVSVEWLQKPFRNLRYLKLRDVSCCNPYCLDVVGKLLQRSPYLESLVLEIRAGKTQEEDDADGIKNEYKVEDWRALLSFDCKFSHLLSCEMENVLGSQAELKFLERLVGCARVLERITLSPNIRLEQEMFLEFEGKVSKVSQNVKILRKS